MTSCEAERIDEVGCVFDGSTSCHFLQVSHEPERSVMVRSSNLFKIS